MARAIERLIAAMDALDVPGEDLEPDGSEEPSLGAPEPIHFRQWGPLSPGLVRDRDLDQTRWAAGCGDSEEESAEAEDAAGGDVNDEPQADTYGGLKGVVYEPCFADLEPSLGSTNGMNQQWAWEAARGWDDAEQEHDGREPDADFEPDGEGDGTGNPMVDCTVVSSIIADVDGAPYLAQSPSPLGRLDETIERVELLRSTANLMGRRS
jgi:hypothetical protein